MLIGSPPCAAIIHYIAYTVKIYVSISAYLYAALGRRGEIARRTLAENLRPEPLSLENLLNKPFSGE